MAADLMVIVLVDPGDLGERRQVTHAGGEGLLDAGADVAHHRLRVGAANIQRHAVAASFAVTIHMLIAIGQACQRGQHHVSRQSDWIAKLALQGDGLAVELAVGGAGEAGEISATHGAVVLTVETRREVQVPRIAGVTRVTNHPVVIGGGVVAAQVVFPVYGGVAVVQGCAQTPVITQRAIGTYDQAAKFRGVAADVVGAVLAGITTERLTPDDPVVGVVITGRHAADAGGLRVTHGII